jgi:homoserine O-acetyltransferase
MGGLQAYHWCVHQPGFIEHALIICATAKTSEHNFVFLEGVKAALKADPAYNDGNYQTPPRVGLGAFGRVYAGWAYSQAFFRNRRYKDLGFNTVADLLADWEKDHLSHDANDLLCALHTWQQADIGKHPRYKGDTQAALSSIDSHVWLMPCEQDLYFRHEDNRDELAHLRHGHYCGYESDFGHCSAGPGRFSRETKLIEDTIGTILSGNQTR